MGKDSAAQINKYLFIYINKYSFIYVFIYLSVQVKFCVWLHKRFYKLVIYYYYYYFIFLFFALRLVIIFLNVGYLKCRIV